MRRIAIKLLIDYEYVPVVTGCVLDYLSHTLNVRRGDRRSSIAPGAADITGDVPNLLDVGGDYSTSAMSDYDLKAIAVYPKSL